ncbi:hypothetical protein BDZ85DRAFT_191643 [Elsinoe ampelina]|uniref:Nudix hydrolase domain-containing protein n=1 Tax=Elsinoe ampelina TaxID=302913 RepID=A0A6A6GN97_9PEZI|nr:hypothetical protein BDZ85DRAFT_191643 [Elsinoe ampelina]
MPPLPSAPLVANFPSTHLVFAAGIAIFHISTSRVVICRHPLEGHYFLPKGRKNASEHLTTAAIREGFEESGYRCRLVGVPIGHRQPQEVPVEGSGVARKDDRLRFVVEPLWTQMLPVSARTQYIVLWFVGETLDWREEERCNAVAVEREGGEGEETRSFVEPRGLKEGVTVKERMAWDVNEQGRVREPVCHPGTGVDSDEMLYEKYLMPIEEAVEKLKGTIMADVVRQGWELIAKRDVMEEEGYWNT